MDDQIQHLINLLPAHWHTTVLSLVVAVPVLGRAYHSLSNNGGLKGIYRALVFGTNVPKTTTPEAPKQ